MTPVPIRAWIAVCMPPVAWFLGQRGWGQAVRLVCSQGNWGLGIGVAALVLCLAGGVIAWPLRGEEGSTRLVAWCAIGDSLIFAIALCFHLLAGSLIPSCFR